ncbi:MAG: hypothetical protein MUC92_10405 [Fimbriimonadaceae bacterium]|jgi:type II secretory pathway component GspD/PulD (secretin)|nr:hypothetical protein [Fimbriimonadaceae bacterium]
MILNRCGLAATLCLLAVSMGFAQGLNQNPDVSVNPSGKVTVGSRGSDVRTVLFDLFSQSKRSFVLDPNVRFTLYLNLYEVEFDRALDIILRAADLSFEVEGDIFYIGPRNRPRTTAPTPGPRQNSSTGQSQPAPTAPRGTLTDRDLQARLTTRMSMADIRDVFREFSRQTGITIEVAENVPAYKVDAFLIDTSLKYALDVVTTAAKLRYTRTNNRTILIEVRPAS